MRNLLLIIFIFCSLNIFGQCQAKFLWYNSSPDIIPDSITFIDSSFNAVTWHWDFGDMTTSTLQNPIHSYSAIGLYNVCLIITDGGTCSDTLCDSVWVSNCSEDFGYVPTIQLNTIKFFDMPCRYFSPSTAQWLWDFGDSTSSNLRFPTHTYNSQGTYRVCVTTSDPSLYCICGACKNITVSPPKNVKISVCDGYWEDPYAWNTGQVPSASDSVLIFNHIVLDSNETIINPGLTYIEENSSLCGHQTFQSVIITYGNLNLDYLIICNSVDTIFWNAYSDYTPINILNSWSVGCGVGPGGYLTQYFPTSNSFSCNNPPPCNTGITEVENTNDILIYPNPMTQSSNLEFKNLKNEKFSLILYNSEGQIVLTIADIVTDRVKIDRLNLVNGLYFIQLKSEKNILTSKLIIE